MSYQYIKPSDEKIATMQNFRDKFDALHLEIEVSMQESPMRESYANCLLKLQEASMWLNFAITNDD